MSEQEKGAINRIKFIIEHYLRYDNFDYEDVHNFEILLNLISKLQKELKEKTTILMAGADKVKQLEKENEKLKEKLHEKNERIIELNKLLEDKE